VPRNAPGRLHGILIIDKPAGWTSHDVVGWVRRWASERKVGHGGTLDPAATGVLPVALNDGTRILEFLADASKSYLADITFGVGTDSADIDGQVTASSRERPTRDQLETELLRFIGEIEQVPPGHSAIRIGGKRAYEYARAGDKIEIPGRTVTIHQIDLCAWDGDTAQVYIACSKGTYIRSIARDLGDRLGIPAYLSNLVRTQSGPFGLEDAWTVAELEDLDAAAVWESIALHPDAAVPDWPAVVIGGDEEQGWRHGQSLKADAATDRTRIRVYDSAGHWRGLGELTAGALWKPIRVIAPP
jgi:tRNA pseudouridine55 synthase